MPTVKQIVSLDEFSTAQNGTMTITTTTRKVVNSHAIMVESDCVFSKLEINGVTDDKRTDYIDSAGATIPKGTLITAGESKYFSAITLASGVVTVLKSKVQP